MSDEIQSRRQRRVMKCMTSSVHLRHGDDEMIMMAGTNSFSVDIIVACIDSFDEILPSVSVLNYIVGTAAQ